MSMEGALEEMKGLIAWSFAHTERSRSFDYSELRVQTSAPSSAAVPVPNQTLEQTRIVRVLRTLDPLQAAWLRYGYAHRDALTEWDDLALVACQVFNQCLAQFPEATPEKQNRLQGFVLPALQQIRNQVNGNRKLYTIPQLIELSADTTAATESCWKRDWAPFWRCLQAELINLDHLALINAVQAHDSDQSRTFELGRKYANAFNRITGNPQMRLSA